MRVLVCGGRNYYNRDLIYNTLCDLLCDPEDEYNMPYPTSVVISGGATGADQIATDWAVVYWCKFEEYKADWDKYKKAAGHIRNKRMIDEGKPDLVVAFPGGKGTADMIKQARKAGIEVKEIQDGLYGNKDSAND